MSERLPTVDHFSPANEQALLDWLVQTEVDSLDQPHILVCRDLESNIVSYGGPFPSAMEALCVAQREHDEEARANSGRPTLQFAVAPLLPG